MSNETVDWVDEEPIDEIDNIPKPKILKNLPFYKPQLMNVGNVRYVILGMNGSGKSAFYGYWLLEKLRKTYKVLIFDVDGEWENIIETLKIEDFKKKTWVRRVRYFNIGGKKITDPATILEIICGMALQIQSIVVVVEEAYRLLKSGIDLKIRFPNFDKMLYGGRKFRRGLVICAQSASKLSKDIINQATDMYVFKMNAYERENSFKYLGEKVDWDAITQNEFSFWAAKPNKVYKKVALKKLKPLKEKKKQ